MATPSSSKSIRDRVAKTVEKLVARTLVNLASERALDLLADKIYQALKNATPEDIARAVAKDLDLFSLAMQDQETSQLIRVVTRRYAEEIIKYAPQVTPERVFTTLVALARKRNDSRVLLNLSYIINNKAALRWFVKQVDVIKNSLVQMAYASLRSRATGQYKVKNVPRDRGHGETCPRSG